MRAASGRVRDGVGFVLVLGVIGCLFASWARQSSSAPSAKKALTTTVADATASTTSTTSPEQRFAIPRVITASYVNDVLVALEEIYGGVVRKHIETRLIEPADLVPLRAIYSENETFQAGYALGRSAIGPRSDYAEVIGNRRVTVDRLLTVRPDCISFEASFDFSAVARNPPPPVKGWLALRTKDEEANAMGLNPTPWMIATEEFRAEDTCATSP